MKFIEYYCDDQFKYGKTYFYDLDFEYKRKKIYRRIRVLLPENYNISEKYPVLYMLDGQNLFGENDCAFASWHVERLLHEQLLSNKSPFIVVGIDSPKSKDRENELCPYKVTNRLNDGMDEPYGEIFAAFVVNKVKPLIDETFSTLKEKNFTGIGGSSMGGLEAFYMKKHFSHIFSFCLCFSPAFFLYSHERLKKTYLKNIKDDRSDKYFFFVGGKEFENVFYRDTLFVYEKIKELSPFSQIEIVFDSEQTHCEQSWGKYFLRGVNFFLQ